MADILLMAPLALECLSPVHIGSGDRLGPLDFVRDGSRLVVVDQGKLEQRLMKSPALLDAYVRLCESDRPQLADFFRTNRIQAAEVARYVLRSPGSVGREVFSFIKTPGGGAYVPGSSIRGAIRSALLHRIVEERQEIRQGIGQAAVQEAAASRGRAGGRWALKLGKSSGTADRMAFGKDHNHDVMRVLQLADGQPIPLENLMGVEVRVLTIRGDALGIKETSSGNPMRLTVEVLPSGLKMVSRLTWNAHLAIPNGPAAGLEFGWRTSYLSEWVAHCNAVARDALRREVRFCLDYGETTLARWYEELLGRLGTLGTNQCVLHLGWGAGFDAMAVTNLFGEEERRRIRQGANLGKIGSAGPIEPFPKSRKAVWRDERPAEPLGWMLLTVGEKPSPSVGQTSARREGDQAPISHRTDSREPSRTEAPTASQQQAVSKPPGQADLEELRRRFGGPKQAPRRDEETARESERAKREQEEIRRRLFGKGE